MRKRKSEIVFEISNVSGDTWLFGDIIFLMIDTKGFASSNKLFPTFTAGINLPIHITISPRFQSFSLNLKTIVVAGTSTPRAAFQNSVAVYPALSLENKNEEQYSIGRFPSG